MTAQDKPFKTIVIRNPFVNELNCFEQLARRCVEAGVTHLTFTEVEPSLWEIDDPLDPYLNWSIVHTSMLKLFPPDILKEWVPAEYARRARELIAARAAVLKKVGLKGAAFLYDSLYWPEAVFHKYPDLRGPRVDAPHSCIHPRYAPCVDRPEVLDMYRSACRRLLELSEGVLDIIIIRTNDSGTGFCWTNLYNGLNGPLDCKGIAHLPRISRFLNECRAGITEGGGQAKIYLGGGSIAGYDPEYFTSTLPPQCGYYAHSRANKGGRRILSGFLSKFSLFPIRGIPNPMETFQHLAGAYEGGWPEVVLFTCPAMYGNDWEGDLPIIKIIECFNREPCVRLLPKMELAREIAAELFGPENAGDILEAWWNIFLAAGILSKSTIGMANLIFYGSLAQRWLTRPLVVYPEKLTGEEKAHYKPYLFQTNPAHEKHDLLDQVSRRQFDGERHLAYFNKHFDDAFGKYHLAMDRVREVFRRGGEKDAGLRDQITSFKILFCFLKNIRNCVNFQIHLETLRKKIAELGTVRPATCADLREARIALNNLMRGEMDNALELARLLENEGGLKRLVTAPDRAGETPFMLGPDIAKDLRKKVGIMLAHLADTDKIIGYKED